MSTKNNPGPHDCYAKAAPDEPMFVLLARDHFSDGLIRLWAWRARHTHSQKKRDEALACADAMVQWRRDNPPEMKP